MNKWIFKKSEFLQFYFGQFEVRKFGFSKMFFFLSFESFSSKDTALNARGKLLKRERDRERERKRGRERERERHRERVRERDRERVRERRRDREREKQRE